MSRQLNKPITFDNILGRLKQRLPPSVEVYAPVARRLVPIDGVPDAPQEERLVSVTWERTTSDDVYATPAITRNIEEYNALPDIPANKARRTQLRTRVVASIRQMYEATRIRRDRRSVSLRIDPDTRDFTVEGNGYMWTPPDDGVDVGDYLREEIMPIESRLFTRGQGYVLRLLRSNGSDKFRYIPSYDPRRLDITYFFCEEDESPPVLESPALNETNFWVIPLSEIPPAERGRLEQWFKDSGTGTCVADALIASCKSELEEGKSMSNNTRLIKGLEKVKRQFKNGMTVEMIQEHIVDKLNLPVNIKHLLPIKSEDIELRPTELYTKSGKLKHKTREHDIINTRPNHIDIYATSGKAKIVSRSDFTQLQYKYEDSKTPIWVGQYSEEHGCGVINNVIISNEGKFIVESTENDYMATFTDQYKDHISIFDTVNYINKESYMLDFQALQFTAHKKTFKTGTVYEYDQDASYTQYPYADAGYLLYGEDVCIDFKTMNAVLEEIDYEEFEVLMDITFTQLSPLYKLLEFPIRMVCPTWFFTGYILPYTKGVVTRYEVRKKFYIDIELVEDKFMYYYKEEDGEVKMTDALKKFWKKSYVSLFGITGRRSKEKQYVLQGDTSYEFVQYLQSRVVDNNNRVKFREYDVDTDGDIKKRYIITVCDQEVKVCPQILNARTLYSLSINLNIALNYPIEKIAMITLDSIGLTERMYEPLWKLKMKVRECDTLSSQLNYPF